MRPAGRRGPLLLLALAWPGWSVLARAAPADEQPSARGGDGGEDPAGEESLSPQIEALISAKEREVRAARAEGIKLLEDFLRGSPPTPETAEALFKLAELTWEEAQADYLDRMGRYQDLVAACKKDRSRCPDLPRKQPTLDLSRSQSTYLRLIREYPRFRKLDTVLYLYAFSLRDQGRTEEAIAGFERLLAEYPRSRFRADAWMALAEHRFYERQDFAAAQRAYGRVLRYPRSPLHGLALFKTAWCAWKLGQTDEAARRFKQVLDLGQKAKDQSVEEQKRAAELSDQALDYLVELFTEDDSKTAEDAHGFLSQIGGKAYSQRVLRRFADTVYDQARYERGAQAYLFLISLDRDHPEAPMFQKRVVESYQALGRADRANAEMRRLAIDYGPKSAWAKANGTRPQLVAEARAAAEGFILTQAKGLHGRAQRTEKESRVVDKELYGQAAEAYAFFLDQFPDSAGAAEVRYLRGDILYFKLGDNRAAGLEYLAVGKSRPVGPNHKDALLNAMSAFEKLRQPAAAGGGGRRKREVTDDDRRFAEAADLYATLFPRDKDIVTVIYKNGQFFYDHGDYDEAVKRFGLIIEQHPESPTAAAAGDRLLQCLGEAKDYANIEHWSRRLKKTKAFAARADQERLDGLIAGALLKQGEAHAARNDYAKAAELFRRVAQEYPAHPGAVQALNNAGAAAEKAGRPAEAVAAYRALADRYPRSSDAPAALLVAARIEESIAAYGRAAALYEQLARRYPQSPDVALALRQAGLLRQTLGQYDRAASHFGEYEQKFRGRPETRQVAFQKGLVLVERKDWKGAAAAFGDYARSYDNDATVVEALVRKAEAHLRMGDDGAAREALARALAQHRSLRKDTAEHAAQARYLQGELIFREYERVKIAGRPRQLRRALEDKAKLLEDARKVYLDVLGFRSPEWATASLLRIGQAYEGFARGMRKAEVPRDLSAEEKRLYREELEKAVIVIEDKALDAYRSGHAKALEIGVYNRHTRALRQALAELDQGEYPREVELRPALRPGELQVALDPIEEIRRD
jgi:cellulose synthase operon protein C